MPTILIVEDEAKMRRLLELNLGKTALARFPPGRGVWAQNCAREHRRSGGDGSQAAGMNAWSFCKRSSGRTQRFQWW